jgi:hypothetical protein
VRTGQLLGERYRLGNRVGGGGMGEVWRGLDVRLNRVVAVKVLHSGLAGDATFRRRFRSEAHAMAQLRAEGVVSLHDYGEGFDDTGALVCYLVMEFVPGRSLADLLDERTRLAAPQVVAILAQAADALHGAHLAGVIHRDVKPGNILIDGSGTVTLVDFGVALAHGESGLTATGMIMGTVSYVSPEQLRNHDASPSSDIYALGVVAYECLSGDRPFTGESPATVIAGHLNTPPPPLPADVPAAVSDLVARALAKNPAERWTDAATFARASRAVAAAISPAGAAPAPTMAAAGELQAGKVARAGSTESEIAADEAPAINRGGNHRPTGARHRQPVPAVRRRVRLMLAAAAAVAVLLVLTALAWQGDEPPDGSGHSDAGDSGSTAADMTGPGHATTPNSRPPHEAISPSGSAVNSNHPDNDPPSSPRPDEGAALVAVPSVTNQDQDSATTELTGAGFEVTAERTGTGTYRCTVSSQSPKPGSKAPIGSTVTIKVRYVPGGKRCP